MSIITKAGAPQRFSREAAAYGSRLKAGTTG